MYEKHFPSHPLQLLLHLRVSCFSFFSLTMISQHRMRFVCAVNYDKSKTWPENDIRSGRSSGMIDARGPHEYLHITRLFVYNNLLQMASWPLANLICCNYSCFMLARARACNRILDNSCGFICYLEVTILKTGSPPPPSE